MITSVTGVVLSVTPDSAVLEVGGVGLQVLCSPRTLAGLTQGERTHVSTSLVVREDSLTLYGFASEEERSLFEVLQGASGVGPRLAQATLATLTPDELRAALAHGDLATLTQVPGIGRKGAQRLVLELKDRVEPPAQLPAPRGADSEGPLPDGSGPWWEQQVLDALVGLGWSERDARPALHKLVDEERDAEVAEVSGGASRTGGDSPDTAALAHLIRRALTMLGQRA